MTCPAVERLRLFRKLVNAARLDLREHGTGTLHMEPVLAEIASAAVDEYLQGFEEDPLDDSEACATRH